ncbi:unnamed protein product [Rotaria magnacalcarata]|uniref:NAD(P)(+)--arginine ADP-ribosyltransferase n=1 Tax=Rotaria magnacalcarata TaxID=392030 RepID=A0A816WJ48_9BILA|nr:unnamed protein product [Rotaria magnacalcarata]
MNQQADIVTGVFDTQNQDSQQVSDNFRKKPRKKANKKKRTMPNELTYNLDEQISTLCGDERLYQYDVTVHDENADYRYEKYVAEEQQTVELSVVGGNQNIINEIENHGAGEAPIIGYADEPLLPLVDACAPLIDILYNLSFYVNMAVEETPAEPPDGLTINESAAIRLYTIEWKAPHRSLYSMLNHTLKHCSREELQPYFRYMKLFLTALVKLPCSPLLTVWRGVTKDLSAEFPPGTPVTWWAFSSTTTELAVLENNMYLGTTGARTLFSVEAINGRTVRAHSHFVIEDEILLLPGTHMIVQSQFSPASDLHIIHLKQVVPEETLLEPPFQGTLNIFDLFFEL